MPQRAVPIVNRLGMHARAAAKFVGLASRYDADVFVSRNGREVNGKSIMGVMMLAAAQGSEIEIRTGGASDAEEALDALSELVANRFGEES
ncbi:Phosphocarrier protein, nitrogen regulation associated [Thioalkalivibrio nitratireducens DSM 14787]|uniref:Phosphocarrier protein, nitrogen regulation associated n=1 Tax=Thioalkalivibrio nitratireducens (strain DSM 14787 / UNIQEM 213 / ALEN2) TaxID=1255043 RepID=L0DXH2_THIND|nr:HPr family phosphocarrier protein [Thioalkalivibrio nitratireducens]AGA34289.1 Phosphocarrier protein, nitrogen regulation associated [Thioalkalivibrio nitratireducens DSM 14787]